MCRQSGGPYNAKQGVEMVLVGYNTSLHNPPAPAHDALANFHNALVLQSVVGVAKAGVEEGVLQIGQSQIIAPSGETVAMASTLEDELIVARCDLDLTRSYKTTIFQLRRPEAYGLITSRKGAEPPP
jgi:predicted amidohydrolase